MSAAAKPARMADLPAMTIAGFAETYTGETRREIPALWPRFAARIPEVSNRVGRAAYGVTRSLLQPGGSFIYMAGVSVTSADDLPAGFAAIAVPARRYAVFAHEAHVSKISDTIMRAIDDWLPASGYRLDREPSLIEFYGEAFDPATGLGGMEIWLPVTQ